METQSFIFGMLTIIGMAAAILLVLGMVKIYKLKFIIANLQDQLDRKLPKPILKKIAIISILVISSSCLPNKEEKRKIIPQRVDVEITENERIGMEQIRRLDSLHALGKI